MAERIFSRIADLGCRAVHIGGGEPLLSPKKLIHVLYAARSAGVAVDYIETNAAWFVDPDQADDLLDRLREAGTHTLLVSISPFHNAHIPFARIKGVIEACRRRGIRVIPWVSGFANDLERLDILKTHSMAEFEAVFGADYLSRIPDRYWIHLGGRALETFRAVFRSIPIEKIIAESAPSCTEVLGDTSHFHIDLHGNYVPGLCTGLAVAMEDLGRPLDSERYPLIHRLTTTGVAGLFALARNRYDYVARRNTYLNSCDLCTDIRTFLFTKNVTRFRELAPEGFYAELMDEKR
jgi:hypothetical protein